MDKLSVVLKKPSAVYIGSNAIDGDRMDGAFYDNKYIENDIKLKESGLRIESLSNVIETMNSPIGWQGIPSNSYLPHGIGTPLIRVQNVSDLILDEESLIGVEDVIYEEQPAIQAQANDIIITRVGTIGRVCRIPEKISKIAMGQNLTRIKLKDSIIESGFALAYMSSKFCQSQMEKYAYGGVQPSLTNKNIKQLLISIPSPEIQKYIGDKVRKAEELREKAKRLKKEAEELLNDELNLKRLDSNKTKNKNKFDWLNTEILTDRIDSDYYKEEFIITIKHLKKSLKRYTTLKDTVQEMYTGKKPVELNDGTEMYFVQSGNISSNFLELNDKVKVDIQKYNPIQYGDLLMAKDGETIGKLAINYTGKNIILNEHTYCLKFKEEYKTYGAYIYYLLTNTNINTLIRREATGSAQKGLNQRFLESIIIPIISENVINEFHNLEEKRCECIYKSKNLIKQAKQDIEDLIEGNFDISKIKETN